MRLTQQDPGLGAGRAQASLCCPLLGLTLGASREAGLPGALVSGPGPCVTWQCALRYGRVTGLLAGTMQSRLDATFYFYF